VTLGTPRALLLPINLELLRGEARVCVRLPAIIAPSRTAQVDVIVPLAFGEEGGVQEPGVHDVEARQEIFVFEMGVDGGRHRPVSGWPRRGLDIGDHTRAIIVTRLGDVDLVTHPLRRVLLGKVGVDIIG